MFLPIAISLGIVALTILIHGSGSIFLVEYLFVKHRNYGESFGFTKAMKVLCSTAIFLVVLHFIEIMIWAICFLIIPNIEQINNIEQAMYFSMVTYTTVGYGDIVLIPFWRVMSGFEAMNGILLFGWSSALFFSIVQRILATLHPDRKIK